MVGTLRSAAGTGSTTPSVFAVDGDQAFDLAAIDSAFAGDLQKVIDMDNGIGKAKQLMAQASPIPLASVIPAMPVAKPGKIICLGLNYVDHVKEGGYEVPTYPALFMRGTTSMMAAGEPLVRPTCSERLDYEAELMVIIGKTCRHVSEAAALDCIFGYTLFNDGSVRDYQRKTHQWTPGKNFDGTGPVGPVVVTPDELPVGAKGLKIESRINGEVMQSASTSEMMWPVAKTLATLSEYSTLEPGDYVAMGTPPGVGHARTPPRWLVPGDVVEIEIEGIGILSNPVVAEEEQNKAVA